MSTDAAQGLASTGSAQNPGEMTMGRGVTVGQGMGYDGQPSFAEMAARSMANPQAMNAPVNGAIPNGAPQQFAPQNTQQYAPQSAPPNGYPQNGQANGQYVQQPAPNGQYNGQQPANGYQAPVNTQPEVSYGGPADGGYGAPRAPYGETPPQPQQLPPAQGIQQPPSPYQQNAQPSTLIRDALAQQGHPVGQYQTDADLLAQFSGERQKQLEQLANIGIQSLSRQEQPVETPAKPPEPDPYSAPDLDPQYEAMLDVDPKTGAYVPKDPYSTPYWVVQRANEKQAFERETAKKFVSRPRDFVKEIVQPDIEKLRESIQEEIEKGVEQKLNKREQDSQIQDYLNEHFDDFFQRDQFGNPLIDPATNSPVKTPRGAWFEQAANQYRNEFVNRYGNQPDALDTMNQAMLRLQHAEAVNQPQDPNAQSNAGAYAPQTSVQPVPAANAVPGAAPGWQPPVANGQPGQTQNDVVKSQFLQRAMQMSGAQYAPNTNGTIQAAAEQNALQNGQLDFSQMLRQDAVQKGLLSANLL